MEDHLSTFIPQKIDEDIHHSSYEKVLEKRVRPELPDEEFESEKENMIVAEQNLELLFQLATRILVVREGRIAGDQPVSAASFATIRRSLGVPGPEVEEVT